MLEFAGPVSWYYLAWVVCKMGSSVASRFSTACFRSKKLTSTVDFQSFSRAPQIINFELKPSRNINALVPSDLKKLFDRTF